MSKYFHLWGHNKSDRVVQQLLAIAQGFAKVLDGLVTIVSFGFILSSFELSVSKYRVKRVIEKLKQKR
ncbi:hypothetical protein D3C78_1165560 [compost metagenome]